MNKQEKNILKNLLASEPCKREKFKGDSQYEAYISHHDFWRAKAREEALEAARYIKMREEAMPHEDIKGLEHYLKGRLKLVRLYLERANKYLGRALLAKRLAEATKEKQEKPTGGLIEKVA